MLFSHINQLRQIFRDQEISAQTITWAMVLTILLASLESAGLGLLLPILTFVENGPEAFSSAEGPIAIVAMLVNWLGLPLNFATLIILALVPLLLRQIVMYVRLIVVSGITHTGTRTLRRNSINAALTTDLRFFIERKHGEFPNSIMMEPQNAGAISLVGISILLNALICTAYFANVSSII